MDILEFKSFKNIFQERWVSSHTAGQPEAPLSGTGPRGRRGGGEDWI